MAAKKKQLTLDDFLPQSYELKIKNPKGVETGGVMTIVGHNSDEFYNAAKKITTFNKGLAAMSREEIDQFNEETVMALAACVIDWNEDFWKLPHTQNNVFQIISKPTLKWIRTQLEEAVNNDNLFF